METGTLKYLRAVAPGTMILLGGIPMYMFLFEESVNFLQGLSWVVAGGVGVVISYIIGAVYNLYTFRSVFNRTSHQRITRNIKERLLEIGRTESLAEVRRKELLQGNDLMDVFYFIVDSNDSLKERAKLVRNNGIIWTTLADLTVLGTIFSAFYLPVWFVTKYPLFLYSAIVSGLVALVAGVILHPKAERRHLALSNDQMDFMNVNLREDVRQRVNKL